MPTDETLMQRVTAGDLRQLTGLYDRYKQPLFGFLCGRTDRETAEDLLQISFERVIRYRASYKGPSFRAWLYTIARNALNDRQRTDGRLPLQSDTDFTRLSISEPSCHDDWEQREVRRQSRSALAALPGNYREVVDLAWKRGLKYAEIAEILGISETNVKVRIHRATKQLRVNYAKLDQQ